MPGRATKKKNPEWVTWSKMDQRECSLGVFKLELREGQLYRAAWTWRCQGYRPCCMKKEMYLGSSSWHVVERSKEHVRGWREAGKHLNEFRVPLAVVTPEAQPYTCLIFLQCGYKNRKPPLIFPQLIQIELLSVTAKSSDSSGNREKLGVTGSGTSGVKLRCGW